MCEMQTVECNMYAAVQTNVHKYTTHTVVNYAQQSHTVHIMRYGKLCKYVVCVYVQVIAIKLWTVIPWELSMGQ